MSKIPGISLFNIIKSFSKSEKRYFKLYATRHQAGKENNCIQLFDAIEKQDVYDEPELKKQFANTRIGKNFRLNKYYLNKILLKSLHVSRTDGRRRLTGSPM